MVYRSVPVLNEAAKENGAVVYYVDTSKPENYSEAMIEKIMTLFEGWLLRDEEGEEGFYVPDVALIVNGRSRPITSRPLIHTIRMRRR